MCRAMTYLTLGPRTFKISRQCQVALTPISDHGPLQVHNAQCFFSAAEHILARQFRPKSNINSLASSSYHGKARTDTINPKNIQE